MSSEDFQTSEVESNREKTDLPLRSWRRLNLGSGRKGPPLRIQLSPPSAGRVREAAEGTPAPASKTTAPRPGKGQQSGDFFARKVHWGPGSWPDL